MQYGQKRSKEIKFESLQLVYAFSVVFGQLGLKLYTRKPCVVATL